MRKIQAYSLLFPFLCIIDNTPETCIGNSLKATDFKKSVLCIPNANTGGIAGALNLGTGEAIKRGFEWAMTLDQDSELTEGMLEEMWAVWQSNKQENIALISPRQMLETDELLDERPDCEFPLFVMTSGNLLNLEVYKKVGNFDERLAIDYVDHDYCLRLQLKGYRLLRANKAILKHKLGNGKLVRFMGRQEYVSNHSPVRRYYMTRNRLFTAFKYRHSFPEYFRRELRLFLRDLLIIFCFEEQRINKFVMIIRGIMHFITGRLGTLKNEASKKKGYV